MEVQSRERLVMLLLRSLKLVLTSFCLCIKVNLAQLRATQTQNIVILLLRCHSVMTELLCITALFRFGGFWKEKWGFAKHDTIAVRMRRIFLFFVFVFFFSFL